MVLSTLTYLQSTLQARQTLATIQSAGHKPSRTPKRSKNHSSHIQAVAAREIARRQELSESAYASVSSGQSVFIIKRKQNGCPYLTPSSTMSQPPPPSAASPSTLPRTSPPRSPKFKECLDDELAPTQEDLLKGKAPLPSSASDLIVISSATATTESQDTASTSPSRRQSRSEARREERRAMLNPTHDADFDLLSGAIESALKLDTSPLTSHRRNASRNEAQTKTPTKTPTAEPRPADSRPAEAKSHGVEIERSKIPHAVAQVPVRPPVYDPHELAGYQWLTPMITSSRPAHIWSWSKRWSCCKCGDSKTIVEQQVCSNLRCQHIRCSASCKLTQH